jgi:hypothetical protein
VNRLPLLTLIWIVSIGVLVLLPTACTNIQMDQTTQRFNDNMTGQLKSYADIPIGTPSAFSFSALGDVHVGAPTASLMIKALQMSQNDGDLFSVLTGDNTNTGKESELLTFASNMLAVSIPVLPAIGNHDIFFGGWSRYKTVVGRSIYSVNAGSVHLIFLDTANGTVGKDQLNWLVSDLQANTRPIKVVVMHFPVVVGEFSTVFKLSSDEEATLFKNLMYQYGVQLVLSGHFHGFSDQKIGNTRYVVTGACNDILDLGQRSHYVKVTLANGELSVKPIYLN